MISLNLNLNLLSKCLSFVSDEISKFENEMFFLKERLLISQEVIRTLYRLPYSKVLDGELKNVLIDNKNMLSNLRESTELHSDFEIILNHLNDKQHFDNYPIHDHLDYIISHFENKQEYETCAVFKTLLDHISK